MKELNRYDFTNDKSFVMYLLSAGDTRRMRIPECDVIGFRRRVIGPIDGEQPEGPMMVMRPDEALILAKLLIDAVWQVTEGYTIGEPKSHGFGGIPIVSDSTVPKDEIHLRQNGKTEQVFRVIEDSEYRKVWDQPFRRGIDGRPYPNDK